MEPVVYVVDDDQAMTESLRWLIESDGINVKTYNNAKDFLESYQTSEPGCLLLDIRMPGMSGLELQEQLNEKNKRIPIVFITGHGDVPMAVRAMKHGAEDFLIKPFKDQILLETIHKILSKDKRARFIEEEKKIIQNRIESLTPRETQVMGLVVKGMPNKNIAMELDIGSKTVEIHRARIMKKMQARSLAELVKIVLTSQKKID